MIDSPQALIVEQVESGVVVRMAVLYELLAGRGSAGRRAGPADDGAAAGMNASTLKAAARSSWTALPCGPPRS